MKLDLTPEQAFFAGITRQFLDDKVPTSLLRELRSDPAGFGIDPGGLEAQVEEFNSRAADGTDPVFHRGETLWELYIQPSSDLPNRAIAPIVDPPFIGYQVRAGVFGPRADR
jgi:hypothetical protein